jgi:2,3-bisphosphoglycerate-independent phosphoglycerate mutase
VVGLYLDPPAHSLVLSVDEKSQIQALDRTQPGLPIELHKQEVDFVCLNFANPDMVGHTGVFEAAVKACEWVDGCANAVVDAAQANGYSVIIIADHGNPDIMINADGSPHTAHTTNLVPCIFVDNDIKAPVKDGKLGDLAPTILTMMGVAIPKEMTGDVLIGK